MSSTKWIIKWKQLFPRADSLSLLYIFVPGSYKSCIFPNRNSLEQLTHVLPAQTQQNNNSSLNQEGLPGESHSPTGAQDHRAHMDTSCSERAPGRFFQQHIPNFVLCTERANLFCQEETLYLQGCFPKLKAEQKLTLSLINIKHI